MKPSRFEDCLCGRMGQNHIRAMHTTRFSCRRRLEAVITNKGFCTKYQIHFSSSVPVSLHFITHNWTYLFCFLCMYGLLGLLPTSSENFKSTAPIKIYLLRKILILPAVPVTAHLQGRDASQRKTWERNGRKILFSSCIGSNGVPDLSARSAGWQHCPVCLGKAITRSISL